MPIYRIVFTSIRLIKRCNTTEIILCLEMIYKWSNKEDGWIRRVKCLHYDGYDALNLIYQQV